MRHSVRLKAGRSLVTILSLSIFGSASVLAQADFCTTADAGVHCTGFHIAGTENVVKGQPYQAQAITEIQQTTANGTHISQTSTATLARDSEGRTMRTETLEGPGPVLSALPNISIPVGRPALAGAVDPESSPQSGKTTLTTIFDPVAGTHIDYTSARKVAHVITLPGSGSATGSVSAMADAAGAPDTVAIGAGPAPAGVRVMANAFQMSSDASSSRQTESLGTRTIDGLAATGTRTTRTIPAGAIGNDRDIVITQETWYSPDLQMVLESIHNDPRYGQTTYSITNLQHGEPDASLFQVPPGYTIKNLRPQAGDQVIGPGL